MFGGFGGLVWVVVLVIIVGSGCGMVRLDWMVVVSVVRMICVLLLVRFYDVGGIRIWVWGVVFGFKLCYSIVFKVFWWCVVIDLCVI